MRNFGETEMGAWILAMWNTGKIYLVPHSTLPRMHAVSSFEVELVSREPPTTTSVLHGGPTFRHIAQCSGTVLVCVCECREDERAVLSFFCLFLVSFSSTDFGVYLYGSSKYSVCTLWVYDLFFEHFNL